MKILFLSDLHLGSPLFESAAKIRSLLVNNFDYVILNGDILDMWEAPFDYVLKKYEDLIKGFNEIDNLVVIQGNHDPDMDRLKLAFPNAEVLHNFLIDDEGFKIKVMHGHEYDDLILKYYWLAKLFFPLQWIVERFGFNLKRSIRELLHSIAAKRHDPQYGDLIYAIERRAVENALKEGFHAVVLGHTHMPKIVLGDCMYINIGDWISSSTYVIYEDCEFILKGDINELV